MKISRQVGTTGEVLGLYVQDATVSTGAGLANIVGSTVNFSFIRNNQASYSTGVASTAGTTGTYSTSAWTQVHSSQAKGLYQFGVPDGLWASGGSGLLLIYSTTGTGASMAPLAIEVELTKTNNQQYASSTVFSSTNVVQSVTGTIGVSTITLSAASTISQGVNATTGTLSVGLVGVSTITLSAASTITQGVNATTGTLTLGAPVGVSTITLSAASTITQGVNTTTQAVVVGVSTIASSTFKFATFDPGAWPLFGIIDSGVAQSTVSATTFQLRSGMSATSTNTLKGATLFIYSATSGLYDRRLVTSWSGSTNVAGVDTWDETPATSASYIAFATPPGSVGAPASVNIVQIQGQNAVTTASGTLGVGLSSLVGVSTITLSAASTITQGVNTTTQTALCGVSTITLAAASTITQGVNSTTNSGAVNLTQIYGSAAVTTGAGQLGVSATTNVAGLLGVSSITLSAASTITQGVNVTTGSLTLANPVGVSTITLSAASTITQGVNVTSGASSGLVGVSTITLAAASTITQGVSVTTIVAAAQASLAGVILTTTQAEGYRSVNAPGSAMQLLYEVTAHLGDFANVGTTKTLHSVTSHAGNVATYGYDSSTSPSSITRTS